MKIKDFFISILVAILLLGLLEGVARLIVPPEETNIYEDGKPPAMADPELPYVYRPNAKWRTVKPEFNVEYFTNADGFRDRTVHSKGKNADRIRILVLGDSFALGASNAYEDIWPVLLEQKLQEQGFKVDIIKAGMSAYDTASELILLKRLMPIYQPDWVLVTFHINDLLSNNLVSVDKQGQHKYDNIRKLDEVKNSKSRLVLLLKLLLGKNNHFYTYYNVSRGWKPVLLMSSKFRETQYDVTQELLQEMKSVTDDYKAELTVVSIPLLSQVLMKNYGYLSDTIDPNLFDQEFAQFANKNNIFWVSSLDQYSEDYKQNHKDAFFRHDYHLNSLGNKILADILNEYFSNKIKN